MKPTHFATTLDSGEVAVRVPVSISRERLRVSIKRHSYEVYELCDDKE
jgi:hypothetical protein